MWVKSTDKQDLQVVKREKEVGENDKFEKGSGENDEFHPPSTKMEQLHPHFRKVTKFTHCSPIFTHLRGYFLVVMTSEVAAEWTSVPSPQKSIGRAR